MQKIRYDILIIFFLTITILLVYSPVRNYEFVYFDDYSYIVRNTNIHSGLSFESIKWAFRFEDKDKTYWHPLTWLSHMTDIELHGLNPGKHHMNNVFFHIINSLLLFYLLKILTGELWKSAFVGALFAFHPLNVDSVAWISERKNVLSTFLWMLTLLAYVKYVRKPDLFKQITIMLLFIFGLMAKPMLVTIPFILLLLDYWPLNRFNKEGGILSCFCKSSNYTLYMEKIPLLIISFISVFISLKSLHNYEQVKSAISVSLRMENAFVSYIAYIIKMIYPANLCVFYPYPISIPIWKSFVSLTVLIGISYLIFRFANRKPYIVFGWLWYLGTLLPVSGLIQAGRWPAMADRFAYIPLIGIFIMITWGVADLINLCKLKSIIKPLIASFVILICIVLTSKQIRYWENSFTLFNRVLVVNPDNYVAHYNLGVYHLEKNNIEKAKTHFEKALEKAPYDGDIHFQMGLAFEHQGLFDDALVHYSRTLQLKPDYKEALNNTGNIMAAKGRNDEAIKYYSDALHIDPSFRTAHLNMGIQLQSRGQVNEAIQHFTEVLKDDISDHEIVHKYLGNALFSKGMYDQALTHLSKYVKYRDDDAEAYNTIAVLLLYLGRKEEAIDYFRKSLYIEPDNLVVEENLKNALSE